MRLTLVGKVVALLIAVGAAVGGWQLWTRYGSSLAPAASGPTSAVPQKADLPPVEGAPSAIPVSTGSFSPPASTPGAADKPEVRFLVWAWNAQMGMMVANGGPQSTQGSLVAKNGVNLKLERQDDTAKMQEALVAFATDLKGGNPNPKKGAHFVAIMGDGSATFLKGVNDVLRKLGPEYQAKVIGSCGYSRGEDKFMGPPAWKTDPSSSRGGLVAGVLRDGDWNIAEKWLGDNGLRNNPDEKTWDPDALNWVAANDYIDASEKYVSGYSEDRPVVRNGKRTGETKHVTVQAVVTWTPGDVTAAQKKGGIISIVSTREYSSQMPNVIIGIDKWMRDNRPTVEGMLDGIFKGGDLVKSNADALNFGAKVSAKVYKENENDPGYWAKYYKGVVEKDKQGLDVELGGSSVNNLADNLLLFGLVPGSSNVFDATYTVFGNIVKAQYPSLLPSFAPASQVADTSYVQAIAKRSGGASTTSVASAKPTFSGSKPVTHVVSRKAWRIQFETGRAAFTPAAQKELQQLRSDLLVASGTVVEIHGHTDNQGSPAANMSLSEQRAFAVKQWLQKTSPVNFPDGRVRVFAHGQTQPAAPNSTPDGRARNRRVEVVLGTTS